MSKLTLFGLCTSTLLISSLAGCGEEREASAVAESRPARPEVVPSDPHAPPSLRPRPPATLVRHRGAVTVGGAVLADDRAIEAEQLIEVPEDGRAVLQLRDGGRVEVDGPAQALVVGEGAAQLFLVRGSLYAAQPPMGSSPRPPLRIVSPNAAVEIGAAGELVLASLPNGSSWIATLGGAAAVDNGESDARRQLRSLDLPAGQAVAVPDRVAEPTPGPARLTAARTAIRALMATEFEPVAREDAQAIVERSAERLDQSLRWLETEARRGRDLTSSHREAVRDGDEEEAARLQRALVDHSRALYRLRRLSGARWERLRVRHMRLVADGMGGATHPLETRRDRVAGALGL